MRGRIRYIIPITLFCCLFTITSWAQRRAVSVKGTVYDKTSGALLVGATVTDVNTGIVSLTDDKGEYNIDTRDGNHLVFSYIGYRSDSFNIDGIFSRQLLNVKLQRRTNQLATVEVTGQRPDYGRDSSERRYWFGDIMDDQKSHGLGAVFSPVTGLYDAFSGRQKRKWRFQKVYKQLENQRYIESRMPRLLVTQLTRLEGDSLNMFLYWYRPSYVFIRNATDYELFGNIKTAAQRFRHTDWSQIKSPAPVRMQDDEE